MVRRVVSVNTLYLPCEYVLRNFRQRGRCIVYGLSLIHISRYYSYEGFEFILIYDIVVYSESMDQHIDHLREVVSRLKKSGLTVNPSKVNFAVNQFSFLGHIVSAEGKVSIDPERTRAIREFLPPRDAKGIARFLGMINYFHEYIPLSLIHI